jgi:S-adenosylmethionine hydrolase
MNHIITLLTDFGTRDSYVAQMKGVILRGLAGCHIVDASHEIPPQDILAGALTLRDYAMGFPANTVHVAVVDPGVGTQRRIIAAEVGDQKFVLPDNGLLTPIIDDFGLNRAVELTHSQYWRSEVSSTFHGRDIMAPVAVQIALGVDLELLGPSVSDLQRLNLRPPEMAPRSARVEILAVDRFGNIILNLPGSWLDALKEGQTTVKPLRLAIQAGESYWRALVVETYAQVIAGELVALVGSQRRVELAVVNGNAASMLHLTVGSLLTLELE